MIIVRITLEVRPEKQLEFRQTLISLVEPTDRETGCLGCAIFCGIEDKNFFSLLEEWQTREDLDRHIRSGRFSVLLGSKSLLRKPLKYEIFTITDVEGMEAVRAIRK
ncbi:antibiotic biosynthesis monooxygenase [bacterium]|nr:antibiotic biosynthesis monooxygenase [bacterium]